MEEYRRQADQSLSPILEGTAVRKAPLESPPQRTPVSRRRFDDLPPQSPEWTAWRNESYTGQKLQHPASRSTMHLPGNVSPQGLAPMTLRDRIRAFMIDNLHRGLTLKHLSVFLGYSEKYCSELFLKIMGEPFSRWRERLRVHEARRLLATTATSMTDIAESLGFSDQFSFSHFFKKAVGCSPRMFRTRSVNPAHPRSSCAPSPETGVTPRILTR